ncbi:MAG: RES family NAD+ phosphorylase [Shimia sp.]|uniref:RES family NAD+ phosphorylase n=1 Tax=Shimia sp. TaxID=1954381 RepID=UPI003B8BF669
MNCCPFCFDDRGLATNIFPTVTSGVGQCAYCQREDVPLVEPKLLRDYFEFLISTYEEVETGGKTICEWLRDDWLLFDDEKLDLNAIKVLLADILDDGQIVRRKFKQSDSYAIEPVADWETIKDELRYRNRYFLDQEFEVDRLSELLTHLISDELPTTWYRARMMSSDKLFDINEMGAPPKGIASHGRANPPGIPYLYLASSPDTGISEIRPHTGEHACVAQFEIPADTKVVDLRNPKKLVSPFLMQGTSDIVRLRTDVPFLEKLGEELTRPVLPKSAQVDYVPSQFLCEFIKKQGFSGVLYSSSVSNGMNLALFDADIAKGKNVHEYTIDRVSVDVSVH